MARRTFLLCFAAMLLGCGPVAGQTIRAAADALLEPYVEGRNFSGSVLIASGDEILLDAAYGWASLERQVANTPRTRYRIGSISKTFTAAAILLLEERGALARDDPIRRFLPDFPRGDAITLDHLLRHTSGLPRYVLEPDYSERSRRHHSAGDLVAWAAELPPLSPPGQRAAYSNANYALLAAIIEKVSGQDFGAFLEAEICAPLGLGDTGHPRDALEIVPRLASGYHPVGRAGLSRARLYDPTIATGAGSLYSTTHDLRRWLRSLRRGDLLGEGSLASMFSRQQAYAWTLGEHAGRDAISAQGWDGVGFAGKILHLEEDDLTVIVLGNLNISSIASELVTQLTALALGEDSEPLKLAAAPGDPAAMRQLAGRYRFGPDFYVPDSTLELVERDGELLVEGLQPGALLRVSDREFIHRQHWFRVRFERGETGPATGMSYGGFEARRVVAESPETLPAIAAEDLAGTWRARPEHNGQVGDLVIRFATGEDGALVARLSLPPLDAWDVAAVPATLEEDRVLIGDWALRRQPDGGLSGELPATMVPVHRIAFTLYRSGPIEPPPAAEVTAPVAEPLWTRDLGSPVWAGVATGRGLLFVGADDCRLRALDPTSGATRWQLETGGAVRARPTVSGDALFVHSDDGFLYALEADSGKLRWRARVAAEAIDRIPLGAQGARYNHYASSALKIDETVYVGGFDGRLYALDAASGAERWRFQAGDTLAGTPASAGQQVFFGSFDGHVYALDAASGAERWRYDTGAPVVSSPLIHAGRVIVGSRSYDLLALDAASGKLDWKYYYWFSWVESAAVERGGIAYVGSSDGQLVVALDTATGEERWRFDSGGSAWSQPAVTDSTVFIGTVGVADYMVAHEAGFFALDRATGEPRWHYPVARPGSAGHWGFGAASAVDETRVFVAGLDGLVRAFRRDP